MKIVAMENYAEIQRAPTTVSVPMGILALAQPAFQTHAMTLPVTPTRRFVSRGYQVQHIASAPMGLNVLVLCVPTSMSKFVSRCLDLLLGE